MTLETFHSRDGADLHFRFVGEVDGSQFIVNVQFPAVQEPSGKLFRPEEHGFVVAQIMAFVMSRATLSNSHEV